MDSTLNFASKDRTRKPAVNIHQFNRMFSTHNKPTMDYPRVQLDLNNASLAYDKGSVTSLDPTQSRLPYKGIGKSANITPNYLNISPALIQFKRQANKCCHNIIEGLNQQPSHLRDLILKLSEDYRNIIVDPKSTASYILPAVVKQAQVAENNCPAYSHCYSSLLDQLAPSLMPIGSFTEPSLGFVVLGTEPADSLQKLLEPFASIADIFKANNSCSSCKESSKPTSDPASPSPPTSCTSTEDPRTNFPESEILTSTASINSRQGTTTNCGQPGTSELVEPVITERTTQSSELANSLSESSSCAAQSKDTILEHIESKGDFREPFQSFLEPNPYSGGNYTIDLRTNCSKIERNYTEPTSSNIPLKEFPRLSEPETALSSLKETGRFPPTSASQKEPFPTLLAREVCVTPGKDPAEPLKSYAEVARMAAKATRGCVKPSTSQCQPRGTTKQFTSNCGRSWQRDQTNSRRDAYVKDGRSNKGGKLKKPTSLQKICLKKNIEKQAKNNEKHPNYHKNSGKEYFSKKFMGLDKSDLNNSKNNLNYTTQCQQQQYLNHKSSNYYQNIGISNSNRRITEDRPYLNEKHPNFHHNMGSMGFGETHQKYLRLNDAKSYCDLNNYTCDSHQNVCKNWRCKEHPQDYKTFPKPAQPLKYYKTSATACDKQNAYENNLIHFQTSHKYDRNSKKHDIVNGEIDNKTSVMLKNVATKETKGTNFDKCSKGDQDQSKQIAAEGAANASFNCPVRNTIQRIISLPSETLKALNACKTMQSGEECLKKLSNMTDASIEKARDYVFKAHTLVTNLNDGGMRNRSFSECSEDSFVVFDSSDCGELDSEDSESEESEDEDEVRLRLINELWDKQVAENVKRGADKTGGVELGEANKRYAAQRESVSIPETWPITCMLNGGVKTGSIKASAVKSKKVRFLSDCLVEIHPMVAWSYAYQAARCGQWEEMARDRERFKMRIQRSERILSAVLAPEHRDKVLARWQQFDT